VFRAAARRGEQHRNTAQGARRDGAHSRDRIADGRCRKPADFAAAFDSFREGCAEALDILASPLLANFQHELGRLSLEYKPQAICQFREMAEAGCLASYGVKRPEMYAMVAPYIDEVLKGANPGTTVMQQPNAIELVINLKAANKSRSAHIHVAQTFNLWVMRR
jgi:hypothetical protein